MRPYQSIDSDEFIQYVREKEEAEEAIGPRRLPEYLQARVVPHAVGTDRRNTDPTEAGWFSLYLAMMGQLVADYLDNMQEYCTICHNMTQKHTGAREKRYWQKRLIDNRRACFGIQEEVKCMVAADMESIFQALQHELTRLNPEKDYTHALARIRTLKQNINSFMRTVHFVE